MNTAQQVKSAFIFALVASVVLGAAAAIFEVLHGPTQLLRQVIHTCTIMVAASACGLACACLAVRGGRALPSAGIVLALAAAVLLTGSVWADRVPDEYWQAACSVSIFAIACGHLAVLSLARLASWRRWTLALAHVLVIGIACVYVLSILGCSFALWVWQLVSIMMILDVAVTILIPYYHWRSRDFVLRDRYARFERGDDEEDEATDSFVAGQTRDGKPHHRGIRAAKSR
jgi:hypothetical protein